MSDYSNFFNFLIHHWLLASFFCVILVCWLVIEYLSFSNSKAISPEQLVYLMNHERAKVIDVREEKSFQNGHIIGSILMTADTNIAVFKKYQSRQIVLIHHHKQNIEKLLDQFLSAGFQKVAYLEGGIQAWQQANLPLERGKNTNTGIKQLSPKTSKTSKIGEKTQ